MKDAISFFDLLDEYIQKKIEYSDAVKNGDYYASNLALEILDLREKIIEVL